MRTMEEDQPNETNEDAVGMQWACFGAAQLSGLCSCVESEPAKWIPLYLGTFVVQSDWQFCLNMNVFE